MEILLNELSLSAQFNSVENFIEAGIKRILPVFNELSHDDLVFKKYDLFTRKVTENHTIHEILTGTASRTYDEIRRFKAYLSYFFEAPYWEDNARHIGSVSYICNNVLVSLTSLAEACERDRMLISFYHQDYESDQISVQKGEEIIVVDNLSKRDDYLEACRRRGILNFREYCTRKFSRTKLDFSTIYDKAGFELILDEGQERVFLTGFQKFSALSWQQISVDDGFDYKEFNNKKYFREIRHKIHKFRISQKYRCFGYTTEGIFHVLLFDLSHKLSDKG